MIPRMLLVKNDTVCDSDTGIFAILKKRLVNIGISEHANHLSDRTQYTQFENLSSDKTVVCNGACRLCPRSPLIYSLYTNDLDKNGQNATIQTFLSQLKLVLTVHKTKTKKAQKLLPISTLQGDAIDSVTSYTFLGILLDD